MEMDWTLIENIIGKELPLCLKKFLNSSGYDSLFSVEQLCDDGISEIERHLQNNSDVLNELNCCYSEIYKNQKLFKLLPGHRAILRVIPKFAAQLRKEPVEPRPISAENTHSVILSDLINTSDANSKRDPHHAVYSDLNRFFFTYIYILCGKLCYETLRKNIPIPSTKTIRKCSKITYFIFVLS